MNVLHAAELLRIKANSQLNPKAKSTLGQFFTPHPISLYMASLFDKIEGDVSLLDPGCGSGSLTAAFVDESLRRKKNSSIDDHWDSAFRCCVDVININAIDIDPLIEPYISETLSLCVEKLEKNKVPIKANFSLDDFILSQAKNSGLFIGGAKSYSHVIMNPPYKKIATKSDHRKALKSLGIETVNLYAGFVALSISKLRAGGELIAIIPRSFCNGVYYQPFREFILHETAIQHIHIFDSRSKAFADDNVLQENIIIHLIKGIKQQSVTITSSPAADFRIDRSTQSVTATDITTRTVSFTGIVKSNDRRKFIHIAANERDRAIIDRLSYFSSTLDDIKLKVSTGPVVDFRLKDDLRQNIESGAVPLIYPTHLKGGVDWPKNSKKPNAISVSEKSQGWLWKNSGNFLIVKRFSSKEEKRRVVASHYDGTLPGELIGFDNKLNVFHAAKQGFAQDVALGLYIYLNSTLLDKYYRLFGGHTQVNATDLRAINYPNLESLKFMGNKALGKKLSQKQIDEILEEELAKMAGDNNNPLVVQEKIDRALEILALLGMPKAQQNERSALTLLSLIDLKPDGFWADLKRPMIGVTPIMNWCEEFYGKRYAPNTRETFRRQTLHQFIDGGLCLYNPDKPDRPVNSPKACYQITVELFDILVKYGTDEWDIALADWLKDKETLVANYAKEREMEMIPLTLDDGTEIKLSPGSHSQLIRDIVVEFGPRFAPGAEVIYLGDTGAKEDFFKKDSLAQLGVTVDRKGKLPDVVLYWSERDWLLLIESVTSHGPVDSKRHNELSNLFTDAKPGLVYVTAFPDRKTMAKYLADISWETEVWTADAPTHMIHFNGDRFLGPHE
ncbi:MAG: N-6 DNA methylase [Chamaesiphon sp. CSU_1_12]|nr:N-6 DNA methylase [Chamaesiphon sp. CSU_1_12]